MHINFVVDDGIVVAPSGIGNVSYVVYYSVVTDQLFNVSVSLSGIIVDIELVHVGQDQDAMLYIGGEFIAEGPPSGPTPNLVGVCVFQSAFCPAAAAIPVVPSRALALLLDPNGETLFVLDFYGTLWYMDLQTS